jgi:hypothetical protein
MLNPEDKPDWSIKLEKKFFDEKIHKIKNRNIISFEKSENEVKQ